MSDIDIGRPIYIQNVRYIYWTSDIDLGIIGVILSPTAPHESKAGVNTRLSRVLLSGRC